MRQRPPPWWDDAVRVSRTSKLLGVEIPETVASDVPEIWGATLLLRMALAPSNDMDAKIDTAQYIVQILCSHSRVRKVQEYIASVWDTWLDTHPWTDHTSHILHMYALLWRACWPTMPQAGTKPLRWWVQGALHTGAHQHACLTWTTLCAQVRGYTSDDSMRPKRSCHTGLLCCLRGNTAAYWPQCQRLGMKKYAHCCNLSLSMAKPSGPWHVNVRVPRHSRRVLSASAHGSAIQGMPWLPGSRRQMHL